MLVYLSAGIVLGLSAGFSPGPMFALIVSQSVRHGVREGMKVAVVPTLTDVPIILVATFLLSRIGDIKPALGIVSVVGALVLFKLAYESARSAPAGAAVAVDEPHSIRKGVLVNILNPHPYLFWVTVGAPMILNGWAKGPRFALAFVFGLYVCLVSSQVVLAVIAARSRRLLDGKGYLLMMRVLGVLLALFAVLLLKDGMTLAGLL